ncbi:MAG: ribonuclease III [Candidatus Taylorbacteria bacterium]|nr:ribonuclease III [Candidatus Taylorbacteria bacterium]
MDIAQCEKTLDVVFKNKTLLQTAFTHRSFLNENRRVKIEHNERLEFLGDAVLELIVTEYLFAKYPNKPEGELTAFRSALVNANILSELALKLGLNSFIMLSRGEAKDTGRARQYILANAFEAVVGAIFLDQGYGAAQKFIETNLLPLTDGIVHGKAWLDAKSHFQEKAQEIVGITPAYTTLSEIGPDHNKQFTVGVFLGSEKIAEGTGQSKQEAEQSAAKAALTVKAWE